MRYVFSSCSVSDWLVAREQGDASGISVINLLAPLSLGLRRGGHHLLGVLVSEKQLKGIPEVPDFVLWLNSYYFVLFDCFPWFLHFLTSLIKCALWNSMRKP